MPATLSVAPCTLSVAPSALTLPPAWPTVAIDLLSTAPQVVAQTTPTGRIVSRLLVDDGKLYVFFGDYGANTGPIAIVALDLADLPAGFVTEFTAPTEQTWSATPLPGGDLLIPCVDLRDGSSAAYARRSSGVWASVATVDPIPVHAFAMAVTDDAMYLAGAGDGGDHIVSVWASTDGGATWAESLAADPEASGFARVHELCVLNGTVLAFYDDGVQKVFALPSGGDWAQIDAGDTARVSDAHPFMRGGVEVALCVERGKNLGFPRSEPVNVHALPADTAVRTATAAALTDVRASDISITPDGATAYLLNGRAVWRLGSTGDAMRLRRLDRECLSLTVSADTAYFGTADSTVYSSPLADLEL